MKIITIILTALIIGLMVPVSQAKSAGKSNDTYYKGIHLTIDNETYGYDLECTDDHFILADDNLTPEMAIPAEFGEGEVIDKTYNVVNLNDGSSELYFFTDVYYFGIKKPEQTSVFARINDAPGLKGEQRCATTSALSCKSTATTDKDGYYHVTVTFY